MTLKDFVRQSLIEIAEGVHEAHELVMAAGAHVARDRDRCEVKFDVAVTTTAKDESGGKGGIQVLGIGFGMKASDSHEQTAVSRIQFPVLMSLPASSEKKRRSLQEEQRRTRREA